MSASRALGGSSRAGRVLGPSLDKIIKNVAWRKNSHLVSSCKCAIDKLETIGDLSDPDHKSPLFGISSPDAEIALQPLVLALDSSSLKVVEPALECSIRLFSLGLIRGEVNSMHGDNGPSTLTFHLFDVICKCGGLGDEVTELAVLRALLSAIRSPSLLIRGDCLLQIVRACYNVYLESSSGTNQICAKAVLAQIMVIVFSRVQEDKMDVNICSISVYDLLEFNDKNLSEGNSIQIAQAFINEVLAASETDTTENLHVFFPNLENGDNSQPQSDEKLEAGHGESNTSQASTGDSKIREDGFLLFRNLCKLSMKFTAQEHSDDDILLKGKVLSLELLRVVMDNASPIWRSNERFLGSLKQYLCLSLLKNSGLSVMTIFQLLCSIFMSLLVKFRAGLKAEIGIFFPMLILRVLENVSQPSFLQKMTVLGILDKISQDPNIIIDIFVNYDCDVDAPNIFERTVNGLLKTSLGPASTSSTTLSLPQDITFRIESVKCLSSIIKSMGIWMDQQLRIESFYSEKNDTTYSSMGNGSFSVGEGAFPDLEHHHESSSELSDASSFEQRRTFKVELQKGISLFNRKPSKGIDFLIKNKKIGSSSEEVASFLKRTSGLNKGMIGDYLGDRDEFPLKVMHAYIDSFDLEAMDFAEAIRFFLMGFRLPGEAQKIDRLMEKFAERYCKCNPNSFTRADTAYVLAYSVIMLNTDAHNDMVKEKMTKADFIRNNRGIDDGKDLPEEYLGALYDKIIRNEIKMSVEGSGAQGKQVNGLNKLLGLDGILNLVFWKQSEEKPMGANVALISRIQEQFESKAGNSESTYYAITDAAILRFMVEVYWGPMLAAFSVTLDQSDDKEAISQCLVGFKYAVHVTAVMAMRTQRDAFVTTVAKFTYLHCAADMKQKNIDAMKAMISIAIEEGNKLDEAWEHVLTCLSRFEHLQLLGDGVLPDASFFTNKEAQDKSPLNKKEALQSPAVMAVVRGGSYDSTSVGPNTVVAALVTSEQINSFILNLNLLDQIGSFELNHIFAHSQRLNSDAIVSFVKSLCKVAMSELQSPTDPRVFSLTKIVEVAHYNMDRIRLVWSRIWNVLSDFFVSVGLSENLSVAIFVMDSLRQLAMKFLEREELVNYNFQNEFLRPFIVVMQRSGSAEIRELIVRCVSQMVLSRVHNVKSGWRSVFMVFTAAASDERKNIVLLAFETMEKIVREHFLYITETETATFADCVNCLVTFTTGRFNSEVSLSAIAFFRFCAAKLAEAFRGEGEEDESRSYWLPLLTGLSRLASDSRSTVRKTSLEVLFGVLSDHGRLFSPAFFDELFVSVVLPVYSSADSPSTPGGHDSAASCGSVESLVDTYARFFSVLRPRLPDVVAVLTDLIRSSSHGLAATGISALLRLLTKLRAHLSESEWSDVLRTLDAVNASVCSGFSKLMSDADGGAGERFGRLEPALSDPDDDDGLQSMAYVVSRMKGHISVQLLIIRMLEDLHSRCALSPPNARAVMEIYSSVASNARAVRAARTLRRKLDRACAALELSEPPSLHFEIESSQGFLRFLQSPSLSSADPDAVERMTVDTCTHVLRAYLDCAREPPLPLGSVGGAVRWVLPPPSGMKEEMDARSSMAASALRALHTMQLDAYARHAARLFPVMVDLVRIDHGSVEIQLALSHTFEYCIAPILFKSL